MATIQLPCGRLAIVDDDDLAALSDHRWSLTGNGYVLSQSTGVLMHRLLLNPSTRRVVDHINGDPLDNRRCNLRLATRRQNAANMTRHRDNRSGFKGVAWSRSRRSSKKYFARIIHEGRQICLGYFADPKEAADAYDAAAIKYHGEFARTNAMIGPAPIPRHQPEDEIVA